MDKPKDEMLIKISKGRRIPQGTGTQSISITIPSWIKSVIEEEAIYRKKSISYVIYYLLYCGLKAHVGEFTAPADNQFKKRYLERGRKWTEE